MILEVENDINTQEKMLFDNLEKDNVYNNNKNNKKIEINKNQQIDSDNNNEKLNNLIENESPAQILLRLGIVELATRLFKNADLIKNVDKSNDNENIEQLNVPTVSPSLLIKNNFLNECKSKNNKIN